jgi:UDP-glucose:(heptosyl)LPS alpha-1,3-glucosyltransferase
MVGHNYEKKGLGTLLLSLTQLSANHVLAVVGDTHQIPAWRQKAQQLGVSERVFFLGQQMQMDKVYPACDLFVHATLEDVFPIVVLEAMSHGLPVVVSPAPYCLSSNLLTHQLQAWVLTDPHDSHELAVAVEAIEAQPALRATFLKHSSAFVQQYSWDMLAQAQMRIYIELLDR